MLLYLFDFRKVFFEGASKSLTAFFTVHHWFETLKQPKPLGPSKSKELSPADLTRKVLLLVCTGNRDLTLDVRGALMSTRAKQESGGKCPLFKKMCCSAVRSCSAPLWRLLRFP